MSTTTFDAQTRADLAAARAFATGPAAEAVETLTATLVAGLGTRQAAAVLYFASSSYDPADLAGPLATRFPGASVIGCSTAGEFTDQTTATGGISAVALPEGMLVRAVAALGELGQGVAEGTDAATAAVEAALGTPLRDLDPNRYVGFVLLDGMHGSEELVNERLGNAAPVLDIVGGSAGDDLAFARTWVAVGERVSWNGVAFMVVESAVPFRVVKTCSFRPAGKSLRITKADVATRTVLQFDGRPAMEAYADALGVEVSALTGTWGSHPVGLMIDGEPWIRSPQGPTAGGGIKFYAQILEGMDVEVMTATDLQGDTAAAIALAKSDLGGHAGGAVLFNCILRRLEMDATGSSDAFVSSLGGVPAAGFHTYGETWLGHVNQTLTGVVFG